MMRRALLAALLVLAPTGGRADEIRGAPIERPRPGQVAEARVGAGPARMSGAGRLAGFALACGRPAGADSEIRARVRVAGAEQALAVALTGADQREARDDLLMVPVMSGHALDVTIAASPGVAAGDGACTWWIDYVPAAAGRPFLYFFPSPPAPTAIGKPASPPMAPEAPPWAVEPSTPPGAAILMPTAYSVLARAREPLSAPALDILGGVTVTRQELEKPWARSYNGAWASFTVDPGRPTQRIFLVNHAENKNEILGTGAVRDRRRQPGTVGNFPLVPDDPGTWEGYREDGSYGAAWTSYFQFVNLAYLDAGLSDRPATDLGPIVWPVGGYLGLDGARAGGGVGQPSAFSDGEHVYVYYRDDSIAGDGMMVARARLSELQAASDEDKPKRFFVWCGEGLGWQPSLPPGFDKSRIAEFWRTPGPRAEPVAYRNHYRGRLSVAKVAGQASYLAVGQYSRDAKDWTVEFLRTDDLVRFESVGTVMRGRAHDPRMLNYPILMNKDGRRHFEIDLDDFFVVGSHFTASASTSKMRIRYGRMLKP